MDGNQPSIRRLGLLGIVLIALGIAVWFVFVRDDGTGLDGQGSATTVASPTTVSSGTSSTDASTTSQGETTTSVSQPEATVTTSTATTASVPLEVRVPTGVASAGDLAAASFDQPTQPGSMLLAFLAYHSNELVSAPAGWTLLVKGDGNAVDVEIYQRIAIGDEGAVSFGFGSPTRWVVQLIEIVGVGPPSQVLGGSSELADVTTFGTGTVQARSDGPGLAIAAVTYNVDVNASSWSDGFGTIASLGAGRANNQMHLDVALKNLAGPEDVATRASWALPGRAATVLVVFPVEGG